MLTLTEIPLILNLILKVQTKHGVKNHYQEQILPISSVCIGVDLMMNQKRMNLNPRYLSRNRKNPNRSRKKRKAGYSKRLKTAG